MEHVAFRILQEQVGVRLRLRKREEHLPLARQGEPEIVDPITFTVQRTVSGVIGEPPAGNVAEIRRSVPRGVRSSIRDLQLICALDRVGAGIDCDVVGSGLGCRKGQSAIVSLAPVVVRRIRNANTVSIEDAVKIRIAKRAVVRFAASQIDGVGPTRHQFHCKPIRVSRGSVARGRGADRNPASSCCVTGEIFANGLGYRFLYNGLLWLRDQRLLFHLLLHICDVDGDGHIAVQATVAGPNRQLVVGRAGLVVLARALVRQRARRSVDLEQTRGVATLDAVGQRRGLGIRRRYRAQRHPCRAAVRVLRQVERVARLRKRRRRVRASLLLLLQTSHLASIGRTHPIAQLEVVVARLLRLHADVVRPGKQRLVDRLVRRAVRGAAVEHVAFGILQEQVGIRILPTKPEAHLLRFRQSEPEVVDPVAGAIERSVREARTVEVGDVTEVRGPVPCIVGGGVRNLQLVGPLAGVSTGRDVMGVLEHTAVSFSGAADRMFSTD